MFFQERRTSFPYCSLEYVRLRLLVSSFCFRFFEDVAPFWFVLSLLRGEEGLGVSTSLLLTLGWVMFCVQFKIQESTLPTGATAKQLGLEQRGWLDADV